MRKLVILLLIIGIAVYLLRDKRTFVDDLNDARAAIPNVENTQYVRLEGSWRIRAMAYFEHKTAFAIVPISLRYSDDKTFNANVRFSSNRCVFTPASSTEPNWTGCEALQESFPCRMDQASFLSGITMFFTGPYLNGCGNPVFDGQIAKYRLSEEMMFHKKLIPDCRIRAFESNTIAFECDTPIEEIGVERMKYLVIAERTSK